MDNCNKDITTRVYKKEDLYDGMFIQSFGNKDYIYKITINDDKYYYSTSHRLFTTKKEAERLEGIFKSWGLFYEVWSKWYGGDDVYTVGFNYDYAAFNVLYTEWLRDKKLEELGI